MWLLATAAVFLICCVVMLRFGSGLNAPLLVYPFMALWGLSALACPLFLIMAIKAAAAAWGSGRKLS